MTTSPFPVRFPALVEAARKVADMSKAMRATYGEPVTAGEWTNALFELESAVSAYNAEERGDA